MKTILFCGMGRAGKDTACEHLSKITGLKNAGTTSLYLCKYVAKLLGVSEEQAYAERHNNREFWKKTGDEVRANDPTKLIKEALQNGQITGGVRDIAELIAAKKEKTVDIIVWVDNNIVPKDPTVTFTEKECDLIIPNHWSLEEFHERIERFAKFAGLMPRKYGNTVVDARRVKIVQPLTKEELREIRDWMPSEEQAKKYFQMFPVSTPEDFHS